METPFSYFNYEMRCVCCIPRITMQFVTGTWKNGDHSTQTTSQLWRPAAKGEIYPTALDPTVGHQIRQTKAWP